MGFTVIIKPGTILCWSIYLNYRFNVFLETYLLKPDEFSMGSGHANFYLLMIEK